MGDGARRAGTSFGWRSSISLRVSLHLELHEEDEPGLPARKTTTSRSETSCLGRFIWVLPVASLMAC